MKMFGAILFWTETKHMTKVLNVCAGINVHQVLIKTP